MPDSDTDLYVAEYAGKLFVTLDDDVESDAEQLAGEARLFIVNAEAADNAAEDLMELLDHRQETAAYIPLLGEAGNFSPAVCKLLGENTVLWGNMLLLDRLEILPQFRGQQLGLRYMRAAISRFGMGCRIAAIKPFPLQFEGKLGPTPRRGAGAESEVMSSLRSRVTEFRAATAKLKNYYAREGFVSVKGSDLMVLDLDGMDR
jgi:hypothetical protein